MGHKSISSTEVYTKVFALDWLHGTGCSFRCLSPMRCLCSKNSLSFDFFKSLSDISWIYFGISYSVDMPDRYRVKKTSISTSWISERCLLGSLWVLHVDLEIHYACYC